MNALMSKPALAVSVTCCSVPMFTTKKKSAMKIGGITVSSSRGTARSARPAIEATSRTNEAGPGTDRVDVGHGSDRVGTSRAVIGLPPRLR